jgi:hypothetical protein
MGKTVTKLLQSALACLYPEPEMATEAPRPALFGVRTKVDTTAKSAVIQSLYGIPVAFMVCAPPRAVDLTVNVQPVILPAETVHV